MSGKKIIINAIKNHDLKNIERNRIFKNSVRQELTPNKSDLEIPVITLYDKNDKIISKYEFQIIAEYYAFYKIWVWAWGTPLLRKNEIDLSKKILNYGLNITNEDIEENPINLFLKSIFINSRIKLKGENDLLILNSLSLYLSKKPMLLHWDIKDVDEKLSRTSVLILTRKLQ